MKKQIQETKQLRKDIDEIIQRVKELEECRETGLVVTKLQEAVMWLGMNLKRIGTPNPYPESKEAWEYRQEVLPKDLASFYIESVKEKLAREGWEFTEALQCSAKEAVFVFRRPNTKIEPTSDGLKL